MGGQRLVDIGGGEDAGAHGEPIPLPAIGIAGTVHPLVVGGRPGTHFIKVRNLGQDTISKHGVLSDQCIFLIGQRFGLVEDVVGHGQLAYIMEQRRDPQPLGGILAKPELPGQLHGIMCDIDRMAECIGALVVDDGGEDVPDRCQMWYVEGDLTLGQVEHVRRDISLGDLTELFVIATPLGGSIRYRWIQHSAGTDIDSRQYCLLAAAAERIARLHAGLDHVGRGDHSSGQRNSVAEYPVGHAQAIPAFVVVADRLTGAAAQAQAVGDLGADHSMCAQQVEESLDGARLDHPREDLGVAGGVDGEYLVLISGGEARQCVADGGHPGIVQQCTEGYIRPLFGRQTQPVGQVQRQQTDTPGVAQWAALGQVQAQRERGHGLSQGGTARARFRVCRRYRRMRSLCQRRRCVAAFPRAEHALNLCGQEWPHAYRKHSTNWASWGDNVDLKAIFEQAGGDGREFRGAPFWSWNDDLDPGELRRQAREMKVAGLGGFFMHARVGLITPYLGERWMECIRATVDEAKRIGADAWLYDEDKWPSGSCSGRIPAMGPEYQQKWIGVVECARDEFRPQPDAIATFLVTRTDGKVEARRVSRSEVARASEGERVLQLHVLRHARYVDLLEPKVVRAFIDSTYEVYKREVGDDFGGAVPGIFTDEPNYRHVPWSERLPEEFRRRRGYDLIDKLVRVFLPAGDFRKVRYDYWRTVTELYVEAFSKQIYQWCEGNRLRFTGHQLHEDSLRAQISCIGAAMPHYEYMQMPGVDHLCRRIVDPLLNKQVSSVAHQFGGRRVLSESYGCSGWNMSFEDQKWIGEWQYVQGVNLLCQHLALYSLRGRRKRDYPPSVFHQQPWWPYHRIIGDHFARLGAVLTQGKHRADVLVIHPIESAWAVHDSSGARREAQVGSGPLDIDRLNAEFSAVSERLLQMHRDFDYGDESIIERHGSAEGGRFRIGTCEYAIVVVPPTVTLRSKTVDLLAEFARAGGRLVLVEPVAECMDGEPSNRIARDLASAHRVPNEVRPLRSALADSVLPEIVIVEDGNDAATIQYHQRDCGDQQVYFLVNLDKENAHCATVRLRETGALEEWNPTTGAMTALPASVHDGHIETTLSFAPAESHLLVLDRSRPAEEISAPSVREVSRILLSDDWQMTRYDPNALTLDYCRYRVDDGDWGDPTPTIWLNERLARSGEKCDLAMRFELQAEVNPAERGPCYLVLETPHEFDIRVNGELVRNEPRGTWIDIEFHRVEVTDHLRRGDNLIEVTCRYRPKMEIESVYLIGDFGVEKRNGGFVVVAPHGRTHTGDLGEQGLRFYAGSVGLRQTVRVEPQERAEAWLELQGLDAIVTEVRVNGGVAGRLTWRPWRINITKWLRPGDNEIELVLFGSCRNLLGPHHHTGGELLGVSPGSFTGRTPDSDEPGEKCWTHDYSFVPFGVGGRAAMQWVTTA